MTIRFRICLAAWAATVACTLLCSGSNAASVDVGDGWTMEISPALKVAANTNTAQEYDQTEGILIQPGNVDAQVDTPADAVPTPVEQPDVCADTLSDRYQGIYNSIPFNRSEYNANPSYRHDATMEILTGNARQQTIIRQAAQPAGPRIPIMPYGYHLDFNSRFRSLYYLNSPFGGYGSRWGYGGLY